MYGELNSDAPPFSQPDGTSIRKVDEVKGFGVLMYNRLTFRAEIDRAYSKSNRQAGWIMRVFRTRAEISMITLYKALVRPHLEYACQLWSPLQLGLVRRLEGVQRSYTARIAGVGHLNYWERLQRLKLYSLERRKGAISGDLHF